MGDGRVSSDSLRLPFVVFFATAGCGERSLDAPIDWPRPDEIAQNRIARDCVIVDGGLKCYDINRDSTSASYLTYVWLQRDELHPSPLPKIDLGDDGRIVAVSWGTEWRCALLEGAGVKCWGGNAFFDLGVPDEKRVIGAEANERGANMPYVNVGNDSRIVGLGGAGGTCARYDDGRVKCWGSGVAKNGYGDAETRGDEPGEMGEALPYLDLGTGVRADGMDARGGHTCIWTPEGHVKCWGKNDRGQLGIDSDGEPIGDDPGEMGDALPFVDLGTDVVVTQVSVGQDHTCALTDDGRIKCWGANSTLPPPPPTNEQEEDNGRLGLGDGEDRVAPLGDGLPYVDLGTDVRAVAVDACPNSTCAVFEDGGVKCWGSGGGLGYEDYETRGDEPEDMGDNLPYVDYGTGRSVRAIDCRTVWLDDGSIKIVDNYKGEPMMGDLLEPLLTQYDIYGPDAE